MFWTPCVLSIYPGLLADCLFPFSITNNMDSFIFSSLDLGLLAQVSCGAWLWRCYQHIEAIVMALVALILKSNSQSILCIYWLISVISEKLKWNLTTCRYMSDTNRKDIVSVGFLICKLVRSFRLISITAFSLMTYSIEQFCLLLSRRLKATVKV